MRMQSKIKITKQNWRDIGAEMKPAMADALFAAGEFVLDESNEDVPHDEGTLEQSGFVSVDQSKLTAAVSYNTPYALKLHEHPEYSFQKGRKGKYLEDVITRYGIKEEVMEIMAKEIKKKMGW